MNEQERPSKSQRKRDTAALQDIGAELVGLNAAQLGGIELPERLLEAVLEAQRIRDFEGRRRQLQYIGRLMREVDPAPIRVGLERLHRVSREQVDSLHRAERWRERLLADERALAAFVADHPAGDVNKLRALVAGVKRERTAGKPPRNYRELFRVLREVIGASK